MATSISLGQEPAIRGLENALHGFGDDPGKKLPRGAGHGRNGAARHKRKRAMNGNKRKLLPS
jgi:hypothetical protein